VHSYQAYRYFIEYFSSLGGTVSKHSRHPIDNCAYGPSSAYLDQVFEYDWTLVSDIEMSQRLTEVINTYRDASRWIYTAGLTDPYGDYSLNGTTGHLRDSLDREMNRTDATRVRKFPVYKSKVPWILLLLFCSITLLLLGIANMVAAFYVSVPDIFGYVSSLTRENPYVDVPDSGTMRDDADRTRTLRDLRVQLADVRVGDEAGYIGLISLVKGSGSDEGLYSRKGRLYH
jgi:hypothetical protein